MSEAGKRRAAAGFTLLEMLVILAILALVAGIAFPAVDKAMRGQAFVTSAVTIEGALRAARAQAIRGGGIVRFAVTPDRHGFGYAQTVDRLPETAFVSAPQAGIAFFADGSATGGQVALLDRGQARRWTIHAATGTVERAP